MNNQEEQSMIEFLGMYGKAVLVASVSNRRTWKLLRRVWWMTGRDSNKFAEAMDDVTKEVAKHFMSQVKDIHAKAMDNIATKAETKAKDCDDCGEEMKDERMA